MKNLLSVLILFALAWAFSPTDANAQIVASKKPTADTLVNVDTAFVTSDAIPDPANVIVQVTARRVEGTLAGKVFLWETANGVDYVLKDSLILSNVPRATKIFPISGTPGLQYRAQFVSSGTVRYLPELYILRRR